MKFIIYLTLILFFAESCRFSEKEEEINRLDLIDLENGLIRLYVPKTILSNYNEGVEETDLLEDSILHYSFSSRKFGQLDVTTDINLSKSDLKYLMDKEKETVATVNVNNKIYYAQILDLGAKKLGLINYKKVKDGKVLTDNWSALALSNSRKKIIAIRITYPEGTQLKDSVSKILSSIKIAD